MATLVSLSGAQPAPLGTSIAVALDGEIAGNIGAGCYEAAIVEAARSCARDGQVRHLDLALDDDELFGGTSCGAAMGVIGWRPDRWFATDARAIDEGRDRSISASRTSVTSSHRRNRCYCRRDCARTRADRHRRTRGFQYDSRVRARPSRHARGCLMLGKLFVAGPTRCWRTC